MEKLLNLNSRDLLEVKGGDYTVTFVDDQGWTWSYDYNDCGELQYVCVLKHQTTFAM